MTTPPPPRSHAPTRAARLARSAAIALLALLGPAAGAQQEQSPVYVEDSPAAGEAISRAQELAKVGNLDEASRVLQQLLDRQGALLVPRADDPDLFVEARTRVNEALLADPELLASYVRLESDTARAMLETDDAAEAERTRLLTPAGFDAALRLAQQQLENAHFGAAWATLTQLDTHPSRTGRRAADAAELLAMIVGYLADGAPPAHADRLWELVRRWRQEAGINPPIDREPIERPPISPDLSPYDHLAPVDLSGILSKPLSSASMGDTQPEVILRLSAGQRTPTTSEGALVLHALPTISADTVYVNDSETITAFDRFTLSRKWRTNLIGPPLTTTPSGSGQNLEDTSGVAVAEPYVIVLTGLSIRGHQGRERLLGALDVDSGELLWTTALTDLGDPSLEEGLLRGPVVISEGTVLLTVVRSVNRQRLLSIEVIAFDLDSGEMRWMRQIGSIGIVPWDMHAEATELTTIRDGVLYRADRIGVVTALDVETGRLRWIRRMERDFQQRRTTPEPWEGSRPIFIDEKRLLVLSPDRRRIAIIDAQTGRLLESIPAIRFGQPEYLLRVGDVIVGVEGSRISARPIATLTDDDAPTTTLADLGTAGVLGRVVVAGDELMVPAAEGLRLIRVGLDDEGRVRADSRTIPLDRPGQTLSAPGQLITVDDAHVHSYLSWDVADRMLRARMDASPRDASPAITYAELAYRAGRPDQILSVVDRAVATIERDPLSDTAERNRKRLFASILEMIEPVSGGRPTSALDDELREKLISRMSRVATTQSEQVAYLMAAGRIYESTQRPEQAVERYQEVLSSPVLAHTVFQEGGRRLPAETEATRRLRRLVRLEGRTVYAAYEAEAKRLLDEARADRDPERFDRIARRYPVSQQAPRAWLAAADRYRDRGDVQKEILSLEEGFAAAEDTLTPDDPLFAELGGRLITALINKNRLVLAQQRLASILTAHPTITLRAEGQALDAVALASRIRSELGELNRRPRIGDTLTGSRVIEGWNVLHPIDDSGGTPTDAIVMGSRAGERALWALDESGRLARRWTGPPDADLIRLDHRSAFFSSFAEGPHAQRTVSRYDLADGTRLWTTPPFGQLFEGPDPFENIAGGAPVVDTPLQISAPLADIFVVFDAETMVLVERTGRAAAFDVETGRLLWAHERGAAPVQPVHDVAAGNGFVAIAGLRYLPADRDAAFENVVAAYDLRSGALLFEHVDPDTVRWLRVTPEGQLLAGYDTSMLCLDVFRQIVRWKADRNAVHDTIGAWTMPGAAVYRDSTDTLRLIDTADGSGDDVPLQVEGRLDDGFAQLRITPLDHGFAVATRLGLALLDHKGVVLGADARRGPGRILLPAIGERHVVTIDELGLRAGPEPSVLAYDLNIYDLDSVKLAARTTTLELGAAPIDLSLLDGKILVTAGSLTLVIDAPPTR